MQLTTLLASLEQPPLRLLNVETQYITPSTCQAMNGLDAVQSAPTLDNIETNSLAYDSRQVQAGDLFIAVQGTHTDGRRFLADAAQRGAIAALGEPLDQEAQSRGQTQEPRSHIHSSLVPTLPYIEVRDARVALANLACAFYNYPAQHLCTIGVTGTDGKTTTCHLINAILEAANIASGLMTTTNFRIGGQEWVNTTRQSTLEALEVQQFLRRMLDAGATHAIIESSSHGLELQRVRGCHFDIGVVTNITHEHLDFHRTIENYRRSKARLFEMLDPARDKGLGIHPVAVLNRDDVSYEVLKPYCRVPVLDYGIDKSATVRAVDVQINAHSTRFRVLLPDREMMIETRLVGQFNVSNCLAAIATAFSLGIEPAIIAQGLAKVPGVTGRMEDIAEGQSFTVFVDYAHTPDSLEKVLTILRPLTSGKLMVVFGSAGERDIQKRPIMGRIAAQMADFFVITDEDPREEDREHILKEIARGAEAKGKRQGRDFICIADRRQAIATAFALARAGDTVLLAGKGHEQSMIVGREKIPWDDRRVVREELRKLL